MCLSDIGLLRSKNRRLAVENSIGGEMPSLEGKRALTMLSALLYKYDVVLQHWQLGSGEKGTGEVDAVYPPTGLSDSCVQTQFT